MATIKPNFELHPRLWQIVDVDTFRVNCDILERLEAHEVAIGKQLDDFYTRTGTDEDFFEDNPAPNVSTHVFAKYAELRHSRWYVYPNYKYTKDYIELFIKVNKMLFTYDFDYCLKYFEKHLVKITEKRSEEQVIRAFSDGGTKLLLQHHKSFRDKPNEPFTEAYTKELMMYVAEFLVEDHGWSDEDASVVLKSAKT